MLEMWEVMKIVCLIVYLTLLSVLDLKYKKVPISISIIATITGAILVVVSKTSLMETVIALAPGVIVLLFAIITKQAIGYGDGLAILVMGFFVTCQGILISIFVAITISGIVALVMLLVFHKGKNTELAFIPFLLIGFIIERGIVCG